MVIGELLREIKIKEFPTHMPITNNKIAANKMMKINNQILYNQKLSHFSRANFVTHMHNFIINEIDKTKGISGINYPVYISFHMKTVYNHGSISLRKGILTWKPPKKDYIPNYDLDNVLGVWEKTGIDSLVRSGILVDDNISIVKTISKKISIVEDIKDRELIIKIYKIDDSKR